MSMILTPPRPAEPPAQGERIEREFGTPPALVRFADGRLIYERFYEEKVKEWCQDVDHQARQQLGADPSLADIPKWIKILSGDHWTQGRPSYKATPVINLMARAWYELQSVLSGVRMNVYVHSENPGYKEVAQNLTKLAYGNWLDQDADLRLMMVIQHASFGLGFSKVGINPQEGEVTLLPCGSDECVPVLPSLVDFQDSGGVIYKAWKPLAWFQDKYSLLARQVKPETTGFARAYPSRPWNISEYTWSIMNPGLRSALAVVPGEGRPGSADEYGRVPMAMHREFWFQDSRINTSKQDMLVGYGNFQYIVRPGEPIYPYGRLICTAHEEEPIPLYDGPNFHWHAQLPFDPLRLKPVVWAFAGLSVFQDQFPINAAINQLAADFQDLLKQILNPTLLWRTRAVSSEAMAEYFTGMPAAKLEVLEPRIEMNNLFRFERPPDGGLGVVPNAIGMFARFFNEQAGLVDTGSLTSKKQAPGAETIEKIQNIRQSLFQFMARLVEAHVKRIGRMQISDLIQFVTRRKLVSYLGPDGASFLHFDYDPESLVPLIQGEPGSDDRQYYQLEPFRRGREFVRQFKSQIMSGAALSEQRSLRANILTGARMRRDISLKTWLEGMDQAGFQMPAYEEEVERLKYEAQNLPQPAKPPRGGKPR